MRRVITFALVVGLTYAGLGAFAPAHPGSDSGTAAVHLTAQASRPGFKVVRFAGYTIRVPASWPVYRLDRDPSRCVRYDRHAVYLGQPGANQQCPAHLVGHTATITIQATGSTPGPASSVADPVGTGAAIGTLPQVGASVTRDAQDQEMGTSLADPGVSVTGTYTGGGRGVLAILRSLRRGDGAPHPRPRCAGPRPGDEGFGGGPALRAALRHAAVLRTAGHRGGSARRGHPARLTRDPARAPAPAQRPAPPPGPQAQGQQAQGQQTHKEPAQDRPTSRPQAPGP